MEYINFFIDPRLRKGVDYTIYANRLSGDTLQDLLCNFCAYLNECIDYVNKYSDYVEKLIEWAKNKGIEEFVIKELNKWLDEGKIEEIINQEIFGDLQADIEELKEKINSFDEKIEDVKRYVDEEIKKAQELIDDKIKEMENKISELVDTLKADVQGLKDIIKQDWELKLRLEYGLDSTMDLYGPLTKFNEQVQQGKTNGIIYIPPGDYIMSNTVQDLNNIHIVFDENATVTMKDTCVFGLFSNGRLDAEYDGRGAGKDIIIKGGKFKGGTYYFSFALGERIRLKNMYVEGRNGNHCGEFSGCYDCSIENIYFYGLPNQTNYREEAEAIQLSTQTVAGYPFFGHNSSALNIPNEKFVARGCKFENFSTGLGSHGAVFGVWDNDYLIENNIFKNIDVCGLRIFATGTAIVRGNIFENCKNDILCDGIVQNSSLNRPTSQSCQHLVIENNAFFGTREDFDCAVYVKGAKRTEDEGGYCMATDIVIKNNKINKYKGWGIRTVFSKHVVIEGNTGFAGNCIRCAYTERVNICNNTMEAKEGNFLQISRDPGYFESNTSCKYVVINGNNMTSTNNTCINVSYCWVLDCSNNIALILGTEGNKREFIDINSYTKKCFISNNSDYTNSPITNAQYYASGGASDVLFNNNISKGYAGSNNTQCDATGTSGVFKPTYS